LSILHEVLTKSKDIFGMVERKQKQLWIDELDICIQKFPSYVLSSLIVDYLTLEPVLFEENRDNEFLTVTRNLVTVQKYSDPWINVLASNPLKQSHKHWTFSVRSHQPIMFGLTWPETDCQKVHFVSRPVSGFVRYIGSPAPFIHIRVDLPQQKITVVFIDQQKSWFVEEFAYYPYVSNEQIESMHPFVSVGFKPQTFELIPRMTFELSERVAIPGSNNVRNHMNGRNLWIFSQLLGPRIIVKHASPSYCNRNVEQLNRLLQDQ
jgi:hypothetical protein